MCGFIGLIGSDNPVQEIHDGLIAIQHRGQDAAGLVAYDGRFHLRKGAGLVRDVFTPANMNGVQGDMALGHVRYPTIGSGGQEDAQPFVVNYPYGIAMAHNGNVSNYDDLESELRNTSQRHLLSKCDVELILNVFADGLADACRGSRQKFEIEHFFSAVQQVFERVKGAYSVVGFVADHGMFAFRDPLGIKPICFGKRMTAQGRTVYAAASESVVLEALGYEISHRPSAGEAVFIRPDGEMTWRQVAPGRFRPCVFEHVYFARPDSVLDDTSVYRVREQMGRALADRVTALGLQADVVVPVPESSRPSALEMARALNWPYREALVKNRYVGRTFIMPGQENRKKSVRQKLNVIGSEVEGRDVMLVDDSIVRGTTSRQIIQMIREAGARRVFFASAAPPLRFPCVYGIDMSTRRDFIALGRTDEQIAEQLGADAVVYQQLDSLVEAVRSESSHEIEDTCHACFSGEYPTGDVDQRILENLENERLSAGG